MSSTVLKSINMVNENKHRVGNLNNWDKSVVNEGALVNEDKIENFSIVELGFFNDERACKYLTDSTKKGYLIASVEDYMEEYGEDVGNFFNERGERARIVILEPLKTRFEVSDYELQDTAKNARPLAKNMVAHWDASKKTYIVSNGTTNHADFATAGNQFLVVSEDACVLDGKQLIRLEVIK